MRTVAAVAAGAALVVVVVVVVLSTLARRDDIAASPFPAAAAPTPAATTAPALRTVRLYYYDPARDRDQTGNVLCSDKGLVAVERRVPPSDTVIEDTVRLLLRGELTPDERARGITTEFPLPGLELRSATLVSGLLTLTFDDRLGRTVGGACRTGVLWSQIRRTAEELPGVQRVRFLPQDIFQP
ncbi:MAG TPA: GerMN domain-containing protein [Candidatus Limnocylindria bacterium]|nr:GerMN domain-containing protein [Candidatus Limnocylindria bacterium]